MRDVPDDLVGHPDRLLGSGGVRRRGGRAAGGLLGWQALTAEARRVKPELCSRWCLDPGEPASLLPAGFAVLGQDDLPAGRHSPTRRMLARREESGQAPPQ